MTPFEDMGVQSHSPEIINCVMPETEGPETEGRFCCLFFRGERRQENRPLVSVPLSPASPCLPQENRHMCYLFVLTCVRCLLIFKTIVKTTNAKNNIVTIMVQTVLVVCAFVISYITMAFPLESVLISCE